MNTILFGFLHSSGLQPEYLQHLRHFARQMQLLSLAHLRHLQGLGKSSGSAKFMTIGILLLHLLLHRHLHPHIQIGLVRTIMVMRVELQTNAASNYLLCMSGCDLSRQDKCFQQINPKTQIGHCSFFHFIEKFQMFQIYR